VSAAGSAAAGTSAYAIAGHNYVVQSSTDLEHWTAVAIFNNSPATFEFTSDLSGGLPQQFSG
jgi:hypothetical protein